MTTMTVKGKIDHSSTRLHHRTPYSSNTLQIALLASFALAAIVLVISHHAVTNSSEHDAKKQQQLLSVPLPPQRREAAKGGLPPIPDFVKEKLNRSEEHHDVKRDDGGKNEAASITPSFPLPSHAVSAQSEIILQPTFGTHRSDRNAVFAFAEGYELSVYITFVESLKNTGFKGDVVLSVSHVDGLKGGVEEYLKWYSSQDDDNSIRVISYALNWECYKKSGVRILSTNHEGRGSTTNHGFSDCKINGLYSDGKDGSRAPAADPREARPVATARYELYWIFSRQYSQSSSILILDVRDSYFQSNPFEFDPSPSLGEVHLPANQQTKEGCKSDLFEENFEALNIGKSQYNSRWIKSAYGQKSLKEMTSKPVICSGSTMGSQLAIELYTVAMVRSSIRYNDENLMIFSNLSLHCLDLSDLPDQVAQFDITKCKAVGCDQGFHNYLFYQGGLRTLLSSHGCTIDVHRQGNGAVNSLAAMRDTSLRSQGVLKTIEDNEVVLNNDKSTPSPVVHQFDRDKELKSIIKKKTLAMMTQWKSIQFSS